MAKKRSRPKAAKPRVRKVSRPRRTAKSAVAAAKGAAGQCLDVSSATQIVKRAVGTGNFDLEGQLGDLYASEDELLLFRDRVFDGVRRGGCDIDPDDIPSDAENTQREVRDAIWDKAS